MSHELRHAACLMPRVVSQRRRTPWQLQLCRWRLRLWGLWVWQTGRGQHPIAELVARGQWAALDRLCDALEDRRDAS